MTTQQVPVFRELLTGTEAINKAIDSIAARGRKLDIDIQLAALSCIKHHQDHGDVTLMNRLIDNMPKGSRVNALREFVQAFSGMAYDEKAKAFKHEKGKPVLLKQAQEQMWTAFKPEPDYKPFDAAAAIAALVKKLDAADPERGDKVTPAQAQAIRELAAKCGVQA